MDEDGDFLDSDEALDLLESRDALHQLRNLGFQVTGFSALVPSTQPSPEGTLAGVNIALAQFKRTSV